MCEYSRLTLLEKLLRALRMMVVRSASECGSADRRLAGKLARCNPWNSKALVQIEVFAAPAGARFVVAFGEFERRAIADHRSRHIARERFGEIEPAGIERGRHGVDELRRNHHVGVDQADGCGSRGRRRRGYGRATD
jgi:hypothetical protein